MVLVVGAGEKGRPGGFVCWLALALCASFDHRSIPSAIAARSMGRARACACGQIHRYVIDGERRRAKEIASAVDARSFLDVVCIIFASFLFWVLGVFRVSNGTPDPQTHTIINSTYTFATLSQKLCHATKKISFSLPQPLHALARIYGQKL